MSDQTEVQEAIEEFGKTFEAFKDANDQRLAEIESKGGVDPVTEEKLDKISAHMDSLEDLNQKLTKSALDQSEVNARVDRLETELKRPSVSMETERKDELLKTYDKYLRKGKDSLDGMEMKVLTVSNDTGGGYLAPPEYVQEILKKVTEMSPIRSIARIRATSSRSIQIPTRTGQFSASWVAETGTRSETTGLTYGLEEITAHEMYALVDISEQDVEDTVFDMEAELSSEFAEQFAKAEGTSFVNGTAAGQPEGFMQNSSVGETNSGHASTLLANGLIDLYSAVKTDYARNGVFVFNRATLGKVRQLQDGNGTYVFQAGFSLQVGVPNTILGQPYIEAADMPDVGAGTYPIAFGDFRRGYMVVDRVSLAILRDPFTQATSGTIRYVARRRVGGQVVMAEAIRKQKVSA
jgi:HK97 family phage major capsid protein